MHRIACYVAATLCVIATGLNNYTATVTAGYFVEASEYEAMRLANIQVTSVAQDQASRAMMLAEAFYADREEATRAAQRYFAESEQRQRALEAALKQIEKLEAALKKYGHDPDKLGQRP